MTEKTIKVRVVGKSHDRMEGGKLKRYEKGSTFEATQAEVDAFQGRLVPVSNDAGQGAAQAQATAAKIVDDANKEAAEILRAASEEADGMLAAAADKQKAAEQALADAKAEAQAIKAAAEQEVAGKKGGAGGTGKA